MRRVDRLIPERLSGFQHVLHAFLGFGLAAQAQERLSLQVQQVLLRYRLLAAETSAAQYRRQLLSYHRIVFRDVARLARQVDADLHQRIPGITLYFDILPWGAG